MIVTGGFASGCIMGRKDNHYVYPREIWDCLIGKESEGRILCMFAPKDFHVFQDYPVRMDLSSVAGRIDHIELVDSDSYGYIANLKMKLLNTPHGILAKRLMDSKEELYVTPMGYADIVNHRVEDYSFVGFNIVEGTNFKGVKPLAVWEPL